MAAPTPLPKTGAPASAALAAAGIRSGSVRIRKTGWKVLYVIAGSVVIGSVNQLIAALHVVQPVSEILSLLLFFAFVLLGARSFRGAGEAIEPPRVWWRMTARPTAGFVIGTVGVIFVGFAAMVLVLQPNEHVVTNVVSGISYAVVAVVYIHSSIRPMRNPPAQIDEGLPKWKALKI
ncbi:hypothetical protein [Herbiconiux sp.]|uniref:hypothetical protein n=1 Tax=Herbiconiux sp. TaxID=1871186 RepID=UPI0025B7C4F1|nr:hypothetical protein [Herbiconiux sp.]